MDYKGETYYTIRNLSLYECQGWCREEPECVAASFSFVVNPLTPRQETVCLLQNGTAANNPAAQPMRAVSQYYMVKMSIRSDRVCKRPWNFERVPNKMIDGHDKALIFTSTKEACLAACLNEVSDPGDMLIRDNNLLQTKLLLSSHMNMNNLKFKGIRQKKKKKKKDLSHIVDQDQEDQKKNLS